MEYNDTLFNNLSDGWDATNGIAWKQTSDDDLNKYSDVVIEKGIKPMLKDLDINIVIKISSEKVILLGKECFGKLMVVSYEDSDFNNKAETLKEYPIIENGKFNIKNIDKVYSALEVRDPLNKIESSNYEQKTQGTAYENFQIINKDAAIPELGMHLICHELMHSIADKTSVEALRKNSKMGDEDVNEYFARLATQYLLSNSAICCTSVIGGTTTEEMRNNSNECHNAHGTYGTLLDKRKWYRRMNEANLKKLAGFYFKGDYLIEFINTIFRDSPEIDTQK